MKIGILALQGAAEPHFDKLSRLGADPILVREQKDFTGIQGIILPGGESTTMVRLLDLNQLWESLTDFIQKRPAWGLCAGLILLAKNVTNPSQRSLGLIDICVTRNGFGRQLQSFIDEVTPTARWHDSKSEEAVFIRAPRVNEIGSLCEVLFCWHNEPVMVRQGHILGCTFHPELSQSQNLHRYFVELCKNG